MKKITVQTLPNGYALNFDGDRQNGYMYFNVDDLLKGFMIHIGLNMTEQLSMENIDELSRMEEELTLAQTSRNRIARQMIDEREKHLELVNNIKALIRKLESYPDKDIAESLRKLILSRKAMKAITMSGLGINVKDEEL